MLGMLESVKFRPGLLDPSAAVPRLALFVVISTNETLPVGAGTVGLSMIPATVAVSV